MTNHWDNQLEIRPILTLAPFSPSKRMVFARSGFLVMARILEVSALFVYLFVCLSVCWLGWLVAWLVSCLVGSLLGGWCVGWLVGWCVGMEIVMKGGRSFVVAIAASIICDSYLH